MVLQAHLGLCAASLWLGHCVASSRDRGGVGMPEPAGSGSSSCATAQAGQPGNSSLLSLLPPSSQPAFWLPWEGGREAWGAGEERRPPMPASPGVKAFQVTSDPSESLRGNWLSGLSCLNQAQCQSDGNGVSHVKGGLSTIRT